MALVLSATAYAGPPVSVQQISSDPFTADGAQHATQVEADTFASGQTVVSAFRSGRYDSFGGASAIGWATSTDGGRTWTKGFLPPLTIATGGTHARATDPSVAYDANHGVW